jgi:hypothetical protein
MSPETVSRISTVQKVNRPMLAVLSTIMVVDTEVMAEAEVGEAVDAEAEEDGTAAAAARDGKT